MERCKKHMETAIKDLSVDMDTIKEVQNIQQKSHFLDNASILKLQYILCEFWRKRCVYAYYKYGFQDVCPYNIKNKGGIFYDTEYIYW